VQARFLTILPKIQTHASVCFRGVRCAAQKADLVAETVGKAWVWFERLARKGRDGCQFPMALASLAARATRCGRRVCGSEKARDAMSPLAQRKHGFTVVPFPSSTSTSHEQRYGRPHGQRTQDEYEERLQHNLATPVPDQVAFRLDMRAWLGTLTARERHIAKAMMLQLRTKELSKIFHVSEGRISQLRRQLLCSWRDFVGDTVVTTRGPLKRRRKRVRS
jgi:hypothetical protein